jgi:hypothetical protein
MKLIIYTLLFFPLISLAQDPDDCAGVAINCCDFTVSPQTLTIQASNNSTNIFSYPGFILFDNNQDTIAIETVNYYGIGNYFQPHTLDIIEPIHLPFEGYLELHTLFYGSLACTFQLTIADTTTVGMPEHQTSKVISIRPNPTSGSINVVLDESYIDQDLTLKIFDFTGREVYTESILSSGTRISTGGFGPGIYFVNLVDGNRRVLSSEKLILL